MGKPRRSPSTRLIKAAGCAVWRDGLDGREVLAVHRPRYDDWSLPKGKLDPDEPAPVAAVREVHEESGVRVRLGPELRPVTYRVDGVRKEVRYWVAEAVDQERFRPNREVDEIAWFALPEARARLRDADVALAHATIKGARPSRPLVIVRHALSTRRKEWKGDDLDRPLSRDGLRQSARLADLLACWAPTRIVTSPARRCRDTVEPLAERLGLPLDLRDELSEEAYEASPKRARALIKELRAEREAVVLCTHRPLLASAAGLVGLDLPRSARANPLPKGGLWVAHAGPKDRVERYTR